MSSQSAKGGPQWSADELIPFGKYLLLERISSGATASVYRAKIRGEAGFERIAAIKRILPHMAGDPEFVDTFVREAKTAARLTHTNICPIYELGRVGESLYMAMECVAGKDLGRIVRRLGQLGKPIPPIVAAWIAARLCEALDYAHSLTDTEGTPAGIVHRDLSPANVLVSYEGHVKLIDFGLAKAVGRAQQTNVEALKKKLGYMSPEMVKGRPIDARSDVFGVGVLLHEMITERRLFDGKDDLATLTMVSKASVPPPSALIEDPPEALELVIMRALEREPDDRWQTAGEMARALSEYIMSEHPLYGPRQLASFLVEIFADSMAAEEERTRMLIEASNDPEVLTERREFFASARGIAAAARAHRGRPSEHPTPIPEAFETDNENTVVRDLDEEKTALQEGGVMEEPTDVRDDDGMNMDELTEFLSDHDLQIVAIEEGAFDEEATEIFFNQDEGLGFPEQEGEPVSATAPGRRLPARSPGSMPSSQLQPANHEPPPPADAPAAGFPQMGPGAHRSGPAPAGTHPLSGVPMSLPPHAPLPQQPTLPGPVGPERSRTATVLDLRARQVRDQERLSNWMLFAGIVLLGLAVAGLIMRTPLGEQLGLRANNRGTIEIRTTPSVSASIRLDDVYRGRAPLRLDGVQRGSHKLEIEADGYLTVTREVPLEGGETKVLEVMLAHEE